MYFVNDKLISLYSGNTWPASAITGIVYQGKDSYCKEEDLNVLILYNKVLC